MGIIVDLLCFLDDLGLSVTMGDFRKAFDVLEAALLDMGIKLNMDKCEAWIPGLDLVEEGSEEWNCAVAAVRPLQLKRHGLRLLGTAAEGEFETILGPHGYGAGPIQERAQRATAYGAAICKMARECTHSYALQASWVLTHRSLQAALDYDLRLSPLEQSLPSARSLRQ